MKPVTTVTGTMVPLDRADVDTDQIIPQQFLKRIERDGYGEFLFYNWAHTDDGIPSPTSSSTIPPDGARVLVTGPNFGCGSSREHAPWAIQQWGFEAVITPRQPTSSATTRATSVFSSSNWPNLRGPRLIELAC